MAKIKIFELKNIINEQLKGGKPIESKDIQNLLEKNLGVKKTHSSNLEDNEVQLVKKHYLVKDIKSSVIENKTSKEANQSMKKNTAAQGQGDQRSANQGNIQQSRQGQQKQGMASQTNLHQSSQSQRSQSSSGQSYQGQRSQNSSAQSSSGQGSMPQRSQGMTGQGSQSQYQQGRSQGVSQNSQNRNFQGQRSQGQSQARSQGSSYQGNTRQGSYGQGNQRPTGQGNTRSNQAYSGSQRPSGQNPPRYNQSGQGQDYQRQSGSYGQGNQRPSGQGSPRYNQDQRSSSQGQGYQRQGTYGQGSQRYSNQGNSQGRNQGRPPYDRQDGNAARSGRPMDQNSRRPGSGAQSDNRGYSRSSAGGSQRPTGGYGYGYDGFKKDEDDKPSYGKASQGNRRQGPGRSSDRKNFDQQILEQKVAEKNDNSNKRNRDRINKDKYNKEKDVIDYEDRDKEDAILKVKPYRKGQFIQPKPEVVEEETIKTISLPEVLTIRELAEKMKMPAATLVKKLFLSGKIVSINQDITFEEAEEIALEYDIIAEKEQKINEVEELLKEEEEDPETLKKRPPVVCVMGHVDHGKTSLLDAIRETNVTAKEAGGITQHIGAYVVEVKDEKITFLDTPGHEAFTSMRMRGAKSTDIAILVVAADDGVMPQTVEAINHAKAANVSIIVAINKIDKPSANIERVKQELTEYELIPEDWGGDTIFVPVSAHTKEGIDTLLEMILLTSEMAELKANPDRNARGVVIEAELDKGRGPVATVLVQKGTLHIGDNIAVGAAFGKVRAMMDHIGRRVTDAFPSTPVEILGLNEVPDAGEIFLVTGNEKEARTISEAYISQSREKLLADTKAKLSLDKLFSQIQAGNIKELNLIIKADVQGSVEAVKQSLSKLSNEEVAVRIIHGGVGAINESDVILASASNAIIIGFNVRPDNAAKERAEYEKVDVKLYRVIYNAIDDIQAAMKGMLDPVFEEKVIGHAEVRQTFKASGVGTIAGAYVLDGKIIRGSKVRIYRDNVLIHEGTLASLKRFQDDVKEVATGYECGLVFEKYNDLKEGDSVEFYMMVEVPR